MCLVVGITTKYRTMLHIVYKTTNLITTEYYIGVHSTDNPRDGYLGSGVRIRRSIKKYGRQNFNKTILCECQTRQESFEHERALVTNETLQDPLCLNLHVGGEGSRNRYVPTRESNLKRSLSLRGRSSPTKGCKLSEDRKIKLRNRIPHNKGIPMVESQKLVLINSEYHRSKTKQISIDGISYASIGHAKRILQIHMSTLQCRLNSKSYPNYFYLE